MPNEENLRRKSNWIGFICDKGTRCSYGGFTLYENRFHAEELFKDHNEKCSGTLVDLLTRDR